MNIPPYPIINEDVEVVSTEMVKTFQIKENFTQAYPSSYECKIILCDGRKVKKNIDGVKIYVLIQNIAREKIQMKRDKSLIDCLPQEIEHFNTYAPFPFHLYKSEKTKEDEIKKSEFENFDSNLFSQKYLSNLFAYIT